MNECNKRRLRLRVPRANGASFPRMVLISVLALSGGMATDKAHANKAVAAKQVGKASWYGPGFHGRKTASGELFNQNRLTAAHRRLPLGTRARVTNLGNGRAIEVTINDRGPYVGGRIIDLSRAAARRLAISGVGQVRVEALQ